MISNMLNVQMLAQAVDEGNLMLLGGGRSREMLSGYGASAVTECALNAADKFSPEDRL